MEWLQTNVWNKCANRKCTHSQREWEARGAFLIWSSLRLMANRAYCTWRRKYAKLEMKIRRNWFTFRLKLQSCSLSQCLCVVKKRSTNTGGAHHFLCFFSRTSFLLHLLPFTANCGGQPLIEYERKGRGHSCTISEKEQWKREKEKTVCTAREK